MGIYHMLSGLLQLLIVSVLILNVPEKYCLCVFSKANARVSK